jgi:tetratricopeptide (TPR) repeat protein/CHAT domain-containing protein
LAEKAASIYGCRHAIVLIGVNGMGRRGGPVMMLWRQLAGLTLVLIFFVLTYIGRSIAQDLAELQKLQADVQQLHAERKYSEALAAQRALSVGIEKLETASGGKPGRDTTSTLVGLSWHALFARAYAEALAASERALALSPDLFIADTNRAHALLLLGRTAEAEKLYLRHRGKRVAPPADKTWEDVVIEDFDALRGAGFDHKAFPKTTKALGVKNPELNPQIEAAKVKFDDLYSGGKWADAAALAEQYVALTRKRYGETRTEFAIALSKLAAGKMRLGRFADAEPLFTRAIGILEKVLGPDHPDVGNALADLAIQYRMQGRTAEGEPLFKRSIAIAEKTLGPDDKVVSDRLNSLAVLYAAAGNPANAEPLYKRSIAIAEKVLHPDDYGLAARLTNLATLYKDQKRYEEAEPLYKRSLEIAEKAFGPDGVRVIDHLNDLAGSYEARKRYGDTEPLRKRIIAISEKAFGPDNPKVGSALANLAIRYRIQGRAAESEPIFKRSLAIAEKSPGPDSQEVSDLLHSLAVLYFEQKRYAEAEPLYKRSIAIAEKHLGHKHLDFAVRINNLYDLYMEQRRYGEAEQFLKDAAAATEKALGPKHLVLADRLQKLADFYQRQGQFVQAKAVRERVHDISAAPENDGPREIHILASLRLSLQERQNEGDYKMGSLFAMFYVEVARKAYGEDHVEYMRGIGWLAEFHRALGELDEAEPLFKQAMVLAEKLLPSDHAETRWLASNMALLYEDRGAYREAELLFKRALAISEKEVPPNDVIIGINLSGLAGIYARQERYADAEALLRRALEHTERAEGPNGFHVGVRLNDLAYMAWMQGRDAEAEPLFKRSLEIAEKTAGTSHSQMATAYNNLASLYLTQRRYADAEPLYRRALEVNEKAAGKEHPNIAISLNNLAFLYERQNRIAEAEEFHKRSLAITEKVLGPDHPGVGLTLGSLAALAYRQKDWKRATEHWKRSTDIVIRRVRRNADDVGRAMTGKARNEAERAVHDFRGLIRALQRGMTADRSLEAAASRDTFTAAQWALGSEAAASLAQMAARGAKGDPALAALVRERQDLVTEWHKRDALQAAFVAKSGAQRDQEAEEANVSRLRSIDARIAEIDGTFKAKFPDYSALASPEPLSIAEVQAELRPNEALVLFLDMPKWDDAPEETYVWVVTKTDARWVRALGNSGTTTLRSIVTNLRCGLDTSLWEGEVCDRQVEERPARYQNGDVQLETLPFDLAMAHLVYKGLFGPVEDLIRDKHLLIVPSGPLTQLPFHVLVTDMPRNDSSGMQEHKVTRLGAQLGDLPRNADRQGVAVLRTVKGGAPERDGLQSGDVIVDIDGTAVRNAKQATDLIQSRRSGEPVQLRIQRGNDQVTLKTNLGSGKAEKWVPKYLKVGEGGEPIQWLIRKHAVTVLPAVSSLKALRRVAKPSAATRPMIGFGNPLLEGDPRGRPWEAEWAKLATEKQACNGLGGEVQVAGVVRKTRGAPRVVMRGGYADLQHLRLQVPLPDTADELCAAAVALKLSPDDVLLGSNATETNIKRLSATGRLAEYRVLHFATHGTLAGEIEKTSEPGLILTPPAQQTDTDDGYLSASEVASLKLDADWVVLSACNTAAGGASDAEALSGLARAFIYAGARALLVSHWAVESGATVKLVTSAVRSISEDRGVGRAEALRRAMLAMIDGDDTRQTHPGLWAPFVVVGEGAAQ